ncbi:MAG: hypothetical protein GWM98_19435, partial [Nitrospinaceae bacterium]|nr:hypothetical protein [Nitrospinaceae bacterium]NIR56260.1 hypothetical protein [Nitrospinaceae bacterium]NIS86716.1 hypothetical protein [Nitrospinaceae bacterium]NIT83549.1 hypothetical protein [Nitrospinaceae bacterium]NIU45754.1 hypothetical protein [Nitrospinaceae bacterium]
MSQDSSSHKPEKSLQNQQNQPLSSFDANQFRELVMLAGQERKNLQLLVEYFNKKSEELDDRKLFLEKISDQIPDTLNRLDNLNTRMDDIKALDARVRDFQRVAKEMDGRYKEIKKEIDSLHLLSEHVDHKIKGLNHQRGLVEKAHEDAGRLNSLVWDMDSKIKKIREETKLIKSTDKNVNRLEYMMESISRQIDEVASFKEMMKTGSDQVQQMNEMIRQIGERFEQLKREKEFVDS